MGLFEAKQNWRDHNPPAIVDGFARIRASNGLPEACLFHLRRSVVKQRLHALALRLKAVSQRGVVRTTLTHPRAKAAFESQAPIKHWWDNQISAIVVGFASIRASIGLPEVGRSRRLPSDGLVHDATVGLSTVAAIVLRAAAMSVCVLSNEFNPPHSKARTSPIRLLGYASFLAYHTQCAAGAFRHQNLPGSSSYRLTQSPTRRTEVVDQVIDQDVPSPACGT